jgi:hypothetical protein
MEPKPNGESRQHTPRALQAFPEPPPKNTRRSPAPMVALNISDPLSVASNLTSPTSVYSEGSAEDASDVDASSLDVVDIPNEPFGIPDFDLHYDVTDCASVTGTLENIVQELSSQRYIHNWDEKLVSDNVKETALYAKRELIRTGIRSASYMINFAAVNDVYTTSGINSIRPGPQDPSRLGEHFFGTKASFVLPQTD